MKIEKMNQTQLLAVAKKNKIPLGKAKSVGAIRKIIKDWYKTYLENHFAAKIQRFLLAFSNPHCAVGMGKVKRLPVYTGLVNPLTEEDTLRYWVSDPTRNHLPFTPRNELEIDFAWVNLKIGIEIQGGIDAPKTGHRTADGIRRDMYKLNMAQSYGWILLQFPPEYCNDDNYWSHAVEPLLVRVFELRLRSKEVR